MKKGIAFYFVSTIILSIQLFYFIVGSSVSTYMDFSGWLFYIASCLSHAATISLIPLILFVLLKICRLGKPATGIFILTSATLSTIAYIDMIVYNLYRFHINGIALSMFFGKGGREIFNFSSAQYWQAGLSVAGVIAAYSLIWWLISRKKSLLKKKLLGTIALLLVGTTLYAHGYHIYAAFNNQISVQKCRRLLPYYFPTSANGLLMDLGFLPPTQATGEMDLGNGNGEINYPIKPLEITEKDSLTNIVFILIDSWNPRALTEECMPNIYRYAEENQRFNKHWSCSNGTRSSVFGLFFGLSSYYWDIFEPNQISPLLIDRLLAKDYEVNIYPSASLYDPPFARVIFNKVKDVRLSTEGNSTLERDTQITKDFIASLEEKSEGRPFFSLLFYDLPHSFELPKEKLNRFQPTWEYAQYTTLDNEEDPLPFWNLYRHTCYQTDSLVGMVFSALKEHEMEKNTVVIITGDHSQEFNENKKNYWGHNGNFSKYQIQVPMICHFPGEEPKLHRHLTTHYDIVPTLMKNYLGVTNPTSDYSMGYTLEDTTGRHWHIVGSELNYAFITPEGDIIEKKAESTIEVTDSALNPITDYPMDAIKMKESIDKLNRFLK